MKLIDYSTLYIVEELMVYLADYGLEDVHSLTQRERQNQYPHQDHGRPCFYQAR